MACGWPTKTTAYSAKSTYIDTALACDRERERTLKVVMTEKAQLLVLQCSLDSDFCIETDRCPSWSPCFLHRHLWHAQSTSCDSRLLGLTLSTSDRVCICSRRV